VLFKELQDRMQARGWPVEWQPLRDDLDELQEMTLRLSGKTFIVRTTTEGNAGKALQAAGVSSRGLVRKDPLGIVTQRRLRLDRRGPHTARLRTDDRSSCPGYGWPYAATWGVICRVRDMAWPACHARRPPHRSARRGKRGVLRVHRTQRRWPQEIQRCSCESRLRKSHLSPDSGTSVGVGACVVTVRTIARIPARTVSGNVGHAEATKAKSGSASPAPSASDFAAP